MRTLFYCVLIFALSMIKISDAHANEQTFDTFYEIRSATDTPFDNCDRGEARELIIKVINNANSGLPTLNFACLDKRFLMKNPSAELLVLVPFLKEKGSDKTNNSVIKNNDSYLKGKFRFQLKDANKNRSILPKYCQEDWQCKVDDGTPKYEIEKYNLTSLAEQSIFVEEYLDFDQIVSEIDRKGIDRNPDLVKIVQMNLAEAGSYNGDIDGAYGPATESALKNVLSLIEPIEEKYPTIKVLEALFGNIYDVSNLDKQMVGENPTNVLQEKTGADADTEGVGELKSDDGIVASKQEQNNSNVGSSAPENSTEENQPSKNGEVAETNINESKANESLVANETLQNSEAGTRLLDEVSTLEQKVKQLEEELNDYRTGSISALWEKYYKSSFKITVLNSAKKELTGLKPSIELEDYCSGNLDHSVKDLIIYAIKKPHCSKVIIDGYEEDKVSITTREFKDDELFITVLDKISEHIISISSDDLTDFTEDDASNCYLGLKLIGPDDEIIQVDFDDNVIPLYLMTNDDTNQMQLSDSGEVEKKNIQWQNKRLKLVDTQPEDSGSQSCEIISEALMAIVVETALTPSKEPTAVVARDGSLKLINLPLAKRKDPELHVFLDTLVGPGNDLNYGFSIVSRDGNFKQRQLEYFKGFLDGMASYLGGSSSYKTVTIYDMDENSRTRQIKSLDLSSDKEITLSQLNEFVTQYLDEFIPGREGTYENKKRIIPRILQKNSNSVFVSFGSSSFSPDRICGTENERTGIFDRGLIFDVIPDRSLEHLYSNDQVVTFEDAFAYRCNKSNVVPLLVKVAKGADDVKRFVELQLNTIGN